MSKASAIEATLNFITTKCKQIAEHPSHINDVNTVIEKYLQVEVPSSNSQLNEEKLKAFREICQLVSGLSKKAIQSKHTAVSTFLEQKVKLIVEIFVGSELGGILKNQDEFQIVSEIVSEILVLLDETNPSIFSKKFVTTLILQTSEPQASLNSKSLISLYQTITKGPLLTHLLQALSNQLQILLFSQSAQQLESLCTFFSSLPQLDLIEIANSKNSSPLNKEKSFEDEIQEEKPKTEFKRLFQTTFLKVLPLIQPHKDIAAGLYRKLDSRILSKMNNPLILANYFLDKFKQQPEVQIEVLSCLFILVGKYGLEFENFYPQLEQLVKQKKDGKSVYQMKNSKRFFKLVQSALRSSKVPFKTIENMTKTIIGQILQEQSEFSFWALAFFFNLAKKHRKLLDIVKQIPELQLLSKHYNPKIRSLVNELKKDLNKAEYLDIEKFSKIDCKKLTQKKVEQMCDKLRGQDEAEFKIPGLFEDL